MAEKVNNGDNEIEFGNGINSSFPLEKHILQGYTTGENTIILNFTGIPTGNPTGEIKKDYVLLAGSDDKTKISVNVLKIQECGTGGSIYLVLTGGDETKTKEEIYKHFLEGIYLIGTVNSFTDPYLIFNIKSYNDINENNEDDDYSEIKLHYTKPRNYTDENGDKINCAWRTITWDLFDEFVNKD
tara:strand:- start:50 stop:604 length:555 start_codon:yes stop_codon:yes gene_type:complete